MLDEVLDMALILRHLLLDRIPMGWSYTDSSVLQALTKYRYSGVANSADRLRGVQIA